MKNLELYQPAKKIDYVPVQRREYRKLKSDSDELFQTKAKIIVAVYSLAILVFGFAIGTGIIGLVR